MKEENMFELIPGEKLVFDLVFEKSKKKLYELGLFTTEFIPMDTSGGDEANRGKIIVDMKVDSRFKAINSHTTGFEIIGTEFMNTISAHYVIEDMKRSVTQKLTFDPEGGRMSVDETLKMHKEKEEKPLADIVLTGPPQIYNHTALLYKLRALELRQSEIVSLAVLYQRRLYPVLVEYQYPSARSFQGEEISCRVYGMRSNRGKLPPLRRQFEMKTAAAWISDDGRRLPLRLELNTEDGDLAAELKTVATA